MENKKLSFVLFVLYDLVVIVRVLFIDCTNEKAPSDGLKRSLKIARDSSRIYQVAPSRDGDRKPRGSLQGSSIVSIPSFLPSFLFKNKTRGAVDNACRCASVIIKS